MSDDAFRTLAQNLNQKQKEFFYHVYHWLKTQNDPLYVFLSGGAGVGKSVVLRVLYQALLKYYNHRPGENPDNLKILLCAPTGKAAHNIGGNTIHNTFSIPVGKGFKFKPLDMQQLDTMRCKYHYVKVIFIDEISMVGSGMFNFINLRLQEIKGCTKPFGGISVVAVGDLFQLKPVMDSWIFKERVDGLQVLGTNLWKDLFSFYELIEIMRQRDDLEFAQLLNRLREGKQKIPEDIEKLKSRITAKGELSSSAQKLPHLYTTRAASSEHNMEVLASVSELQKTLVEAIDNISGEISIDLRKRILDKLPDDPSKTMGLHKYLQVGVGVQYELCVNINVEDGMTNGSPCIVQMLDFRVENSSRCSIIWVKFEDKSTGKLWREKYAHLFLEDIPVDWTPILETTRSFTLQHYKTYYVTRRQFPLQVAAGKTIHKAQGSTLKGVVINFEGRKTEHIHYVGLSRVQNLNSAYILNLNEKKICVSRDVQEEMMRLRTKCRTKLSIPNVEHLGKLRTITICFQNCRSLRKHIDDIRKDIYITQADILGFCETRVFQNKHLYEIDMYRSYFVNEECSHGMAVYSKCNVSSQSGHCVVGVEFDLMKVQNINIIFIYFPPKTATIKVCRELFQQLKNSVCFKELTVIMGDFNQNVLEGSQIAQYICDSFGFIQLLNSVTTDHDSCLDHIYINFSKSDLLSYGTLESYFSDHKPVYAIIDQKANITTKHT